LNRSSSKDPNTSFSFNLPLSIKARYNTKGSQEKLLQYDIFQRQVAAVSNEILRSERKKKRTFSGLAYNYINQFQKFKR
jgi:FMN-dependent NADH-azoreductase